MSNEHLETKLTTIEFQRRRIVAAKDRSQCRDAISRYVLENLQQITVRKNLSNNPNPRRGAFALEYCQWIYHKKCDVKYGERSPRLFHTVIRMVSEARCNLMLERSREPLIYYDITACYPNLLAYWITDNDEKRRYLELLQADIYSVIQNNLGNTKPRKYYKKVFSMFLSSESHAADNPCAKYITKHFPGLFNTILKQPSMALDVQKLEVAICVEKSGKYALQNKKWWVPMHDGVLCLNADRLDLEKQAITEFETAIGHTPQLKETILLPII